MNDDDNDMTEEATRVIDEETTPRARTQEFDPGDIVYDREMLPISSDPCDRMAMVLEQRHGDDGPVQSGNATIHTDNQGVTTVATVNHGYPKDDHVYTVAFVDSLEPIVEEPSGYLHNHVQTYDYPVSRLYKAGHLEFPSFEFYNDGRPSADMTHGILVGGPEAELVCFSDDHGRPHSTIDPNRNWE